MIYTYTRVSTEKQRLDRQIKSLKEAYPNSISYADKFTGATTNRPQWNDLMKKVKFGDTIVFDSVSRMSRSEEEGSKTYFELVDKGINLVFLNEPTINSDVYRKSVSDAMQQQTGNEIVDVMLKSVEQILRIMAVNTIKSAFAQAEKELNDIRTRISGGLKAAKDRGVLPGPKKGTKKPNPEADKKKKKLIKNFEEFGGTLKATDCMRLLEISRATFYKYVKEIKEEMGGNK
ncbi:MAG: recombinase family protein [Paraclostridium sp.]